MSDVVTEDAPPQGKREQTKAANRAAILAAAKTVFAEMGYGAASVRDIVRRTDLATGTFYNYFPDKESVLTALLDEHAAEIRVKVRAARKASTTLEDFVRSGFKAYFEHLAADPELFQLIRRNAGTIRAMFDEPSIGAGVTELAEDLDVAVAAGLVPAHDTHYMAGVMVGGAFEVAILMLERGDQGQVEAAVDFVTQVFLGGIERLGRPL